jgi:hypothetical protein
MVSGPAGSRTGSQQRVIVLSDGHAVSCNAAARRYETGVYADEVLQHYFPPALAVIAAG